MYEAKLSTLIYTHLHTEVRDREREEEEKLQLFAHFSKTRGEGGIVFSTLHEHFQEVNRYEHLQEEDYSQRYISC